MLKYISLICCAHLWNVIQHSKRNFDSPCSHVISSIYCINTSEIQGELFCENMISSCMKITCYFHMWKVDHCLGEMVWQFIGVYIINRTLHGRLEIRIFSSCVEKYFTCSLHSLGNILQHSKRNFISPRGHVISSTYLKKIVTTHTDWVLSMFVPSVVKGFLS